MAVGSEQEQCLAWGRVPAAPSVNQCWSHWSGSVGSSWGEHPHLWDPQKPPLSLCWQQTEHEGPSLSFGLKGPVAKLPLCVLEGWAGGEMGVTWAHLAARRGSERAVGTHPWTLSAVGTHPWTLRTWQVLTLEHREHDLQRPGAPRAQGTPVHTRVRDLQLLHGDNGNPFSIRHN